MKRPLFLLASCMFLLTACNDDIDGGGLNINTLSVKSNQVYYAPANGEIDAVKLVTGANGGYDLAISQWNDGFTLHFPDKVSSPYLTDIINAFGVDSADGTLNGAEAQVCPAWLEGYKGHVHIKDFFLGKNTSEEGQKVVYLYSDRKVKINGSLTEEDDTYEFDLSLFNTWNSIVIITRESATGTRYHYSSHIPSGLSWIFAEANI